MPGRGIAGDDGSYRRSRWDAGDAEEEESAAADDLNANFWWD